MVRTLIRALAPLLVAPFLWSGAAEAGTIAAAPPPMTADVSAGSVRNDTFPAVTASYPEGVVAQGNVEYANLKGYRPLLLDLYSHADAPSHALRPLIVYIHGGGWSRGDARGSGAFTDFPAVLASVAAHGYVVASVNYRLSSEAPFPAAIQDVKAAIKFLRRHAAAYGIDPKRVIVWGGSAGGHLAGLAATTCGTAAFEPAISTGRLSGAQAKAAKADDMDDCVQGAALWYGIFDMTKDAPGAPTDVMTKDVPEALGCPSVDACTAVAAQASPIRYVSAQTPPVLLVDGLADVEVPPQQTQAMAATLQRAGVATDTLYLPGVGHGLIGPTAQATREASLKALQATVDFFDRITRN